MASGGLGSQYGSYNPSAVDPYPIEQALALKAAPDSAQAFSQQQLYMDQRLAAGNQYGQELDKQHEFNRQQLAQQLAEAKMKAIPEFAKTPGGARFLANMGIDVGADPGALTGLANQSDQAQQATNLQHSGAGTASYSTAGVTIPQDALQGMTGLPMQQGERPDMQIAKLKAATSLQAAAIHAAAASGKGPRESTEYTDEFNDKRTVSFPANWTDQQKHDFLASKGKVVPDGSARPVQVQPPGGTSGAPPPAPNPGGSGTRLPMAQAEGGGAPPPGKQSNVAAGSSEAGRQFSDFLDKAPIPAQIKNEIKGTMAQNGGKPPVAMNPATGKLGILKPDGKSFY